jgi:hypothetical protein
MCAARADTVSDTLAGFGELALKCGLFLLGPLGLILGPGNTIPKILVFSLKLVGVAFPEPLRMPIRAVEGSGIFLKVLLQERIYSEVCSTVATNNFG